MSGIGETCSDDRFELIAKAKAELLDATNIESNPTDMAALDSILFRCWQMGWLDHLRMGERKTNNKTGDIVTHDSRAERTCKFVDDSDDEPSPPKCSVCGYDPGIYECAWYMDGTYGYERNYCPNCGAKVVGE